MNKLVLYTKSESIIQKCDKEFTVAVVMMNDREEMSKKHRLMIMDSRSKPEMRARLRKIYKETAVSTN